MEFDDPRWESLAGGYRVPVDPRPLLRVLAADPTDPEMWKRLWEELYHQGNVGEASYAAVEHIVDAVANLSLAPAYAYWLVASIEIGRQNPYERKLPFTPNPPLPTWIAEDYFGALDRLTEMALRDFVAASGLEQKDGILALLAARSHRPVLADLCFLNEDELLSIASGENITS